MNDGLSQSTLRILLIAAALAALLVLTSVFPDFVSYVCVGVVVGATLWTSPERQRDGGGWWSIMGAGALLSVAGAGIAELSDTIGGILAVVGGVLVVVGATVGFPVDD